MKLGIFTAFFSISLDEVIRVSSRLASRRLSLARAIMVRRRMFNWTDRPSCKAEGIASEAEGCGALYKRAGMWWECPASRPGNRAMRRGNLRRTILLAEALGVPTVIDFSGCPGDSEHPNIPTS